MDEHKLSELLKDAVADTPPPTFSHTDVTAESARQRARHRNGVLAGSAFGVALIAGATALGVALWTGPTPLNSAGSAESGGARSNGTAAPYELPDEDNNAAAPTERGGDGNFPPETPKQGGYPDGNGGPAGPASTPRGCEQVDRELAAALAGELPAAANVKIEQAVLVTITCPVGARGAAFDLPDGRVSIVLTPTDVTLATDVQAEDKVFAEAPASRDRHVYVVSEPVAGERAAPFGSDIEGIAAKLGQLY